MVGTDLATWNESAEENSASVICPVRNPATIEDSSGMAWNTMLSSSGFCAPQYWALRLSASRRLGSKLSSAKGPVPTAADALVAVLDVFRVHLLAVVKPHPAVQVEHVLGRRLLLPPLGQLRLCLERVIDPDQVLVEERLALLPDVEPLHVRLDAGRQRGAGKGKRAARLRLRTDTTRQSGRRDGEGDGARLEEAPATDRLAALRGGMIHRV